MQQNKTTTQINRFFQNRIFWAVFSLLLAMILWVYYTSNYGEKISRVFNNVQVVFDSEDTIRDQLSLVITQEDVYSVSVTLTGSRRDLQKLSSGDIQAVIDLSTVTSAGFRSMSYTLSYPSSVNSSDISVAKRSPENVNIVISKLETRSFTLTGRFDGTFADGYVEDTIAFDPASISLTGPVDELNQINSVLVVLDRDNVSASLTTEANYTLLDAGGNPLEFDDVTCDVSTVSATLLVNMTKEVPLDVDLLDGGGATGEDVVKTISPATIVLAGDEQTLSGIDHISLATIDLSDYLDFPITEYSIVLPDGTKNLSGVTTASVSLSFTGLTKKLFTVSNLSYENLAEGYTASIMSPSLIVTIRAPDDVFSEISTENIYAVADLSGMTSTGKAPMTIYVEGLEAAGAVGDYSMYVSIAPEGE